MPNVVISVDPTFQRVGKVFSGLGPHLVETLNKLVEEFAFYTERYSKQVTPVDTGRLRASIATRLGSSGPDMFAEVGTRSVKYAVYVHEGTKKMRARPFMKLGVDFSAKKFSDKTFALRLDDEIRKKLSRL